MNAVTAERAEFNPPAQGGFGRALGLALGAHLLLILALTWGLRWKNEPQDLAVEAELWSPTPQQAAPRPAPRPVEQVQPTPRPAPKPPPEPAAKA
ncbi:MAG: protein TolA, partial [Ottowia sp.]